MAGVPAESEVADGHRGGRRTAKDTKLEEETTEAEVREERGKLDQNRANERIRKSENKQKSRRQRQKVQRRRGQW